MIDVNHFSELYTTIRSKEDAIDFFTFISNVIEGNELTPTFFDDIHLLMMNNRYLYDGLFDWVGLNRNESFQNSLYVINSILCSDIPALSEASIDEKNSCIKFFNEMPACNFILNFEPSIDITEYVVNGHTISGHWTNDYFVVDTISYKAISPRDYIDSLSIVDEKYKSILLIYCSVPINRKRLIGVECFNSINSDSYKNGITVRGKI